MVGPIFFYVADCRGTLGLVDFFTYDLGADYGSVISFVVAVVDPCYFAPRQGVV